MVGVPGSMGKSREPCWAGGRLPGASVSRCCSLKAPRCLPVQVLLCGLQEDELTGSCAAGTSSGPFLGSHRGQLCPGIAFPLENVLYRFRSILNPRGNQWDAGQALAEPHPG